MRLRQNQKMLSSAAVLLVFVLGLMLAGCAGSKGGGADAGKNAPGIYTGDFDMTEFMNGETGISGIQFNSNVTADFILELKDDSTFLLDIDAESFAASISDAAADDIDSIISGILGQQVTKDSAEELAVQAGYDSYDEFKDEILNQITAAFDQDALTDLTDSCHVEGEWSVKGNDLQMRADDEEAFALKVGTIQDDGSILMDVTANDRDVQITFVKQK